MAGGDHHRGVKLPAGGDGGHKHGRGGGKAHVHDAQPQGEQLVGQDPGDVGAGEPGVSAQAHPEGCGVFFPAAEPGGEAPGDVAHGVVGEGDALPFHALQGHAPDVASVLQMPIVHGSVSFPAGGFFAAQAL